MPSYDFDDEDGKPVTLFLDIADAPEYGEWRTFDGRRLCRVFERTHTVPGAYIPNYACVVRSQAKNDPLYPRVDRDGCGVILTKREHANYKAATGLEWD